MQLSKLCVNVIVGPRETAGFRKDGNDFIYTGASYCPAMSCPARSCQVLSCQVLSCQLLSCQVLPSGQNYCLVWYHLYIHYYRG